jgi:hypothetical protein
MFQGMVCSVYVHTYIYTLTHTVYTARRYLDLSLLTLECARTAVCSTLLPWIQVDVPGGSSRPMQRWGAGLVLDTQDNLYVVGGASWDSATKTYGELDDVYLYQLRDPFYKFCAATGIDNPTWGRYRYRSQLQV